MRSRSGAYSLDGPGADRHHPTGPSRLLEGKTGYHRDHRERHRRSQPAPPRQFSGQAVTLDWSVAGSVKAASLRAREALGLDGFCSATTFLKPGRKDAPTLCVGVRAVLVRHPHTVSLTHPSRTTL